MRAIDSLSSPSLCQALGQCRRGKKAGEHRKSEISKNGRKREEGEPQFPISTQPRRGVCAIFFPTAFPAILEPGTALPSSFLLLQFPYMENVITLLGNNGTSVVGAKHRIFQHERCTYSLLYLHWFSMFHLGRLITRSSRRKT